MARQLDLITPETKSAITSWSVAQFAVDQRTPSIKVTFVANTGEVREWRMTPDTEDVATIRQGLSLINRGVFMTGAGITLQEWLIKQGQEYAILGPGTISGAVD